MALFLATYLLMLLKMEQLLFYWSKNFTGALDTDLDTNNDGIFDIISLGSNR